MQGNRDDSWSVNASANCGYVSQATRGFSNYNVQQPTRYNFQTQQNLHFPHTQIRGLPHRRQFGDATHVDEVVRIDKIVNKTRKSLVAAGENVSSTRVSFSVLSQLQSDFGRPLGMQIQDVPSIRQLMALEGNESVAERLLRDNYQLKSDANLAAAYDDCVGTSSRAYKPNLLCPLPMKTGSTSGDHVHDWNNGVSTDFRIRDQLHTNSNWAAQAQETGKKGEEIAYRYYAKQYGKDGLVRWVNEKSETGSPYDLIVKKQGGKKEYIEVKATVSSKKDYFNLTMREWQFANEKGESYVIAHVLLGNTNAILTQHRNLVKLCHEGLLRLLILMPNQRNEVKVTF